MKRAPTPFETSLRAFRDLTATPADGAATRTRVLARAGQSADRRVTFRRTSLAIAAGLVALSSASAALTTGARRWRAAAPVGLERVSTPDSKALVRRASFRVIPLAVDQSDVSPAETEARAYGLAHRAHFVDDAPGRALTAWNEYLVAYPGGVFAPEARYNRALCLVRLGQLHEAARALRPFLRTGPDGYRRTEAGLLSDWVHDRLKAERASGDR
jgi:TolA-binding protein